MANGNYFILMVDDMSGRTTVRATCPDCGDIVITSDQVTLRLMHGEGSGHYRFICPQCSKITLKVASETIVNLLKQADVKEEYWELPLELMERPTSGTLEEDDIIDFNLAADDGTLFDKITKRGQ